MHNLFRMDSKLMIWACKFADLLWLNLLTGIFCLPVISIGSSLAAMHTVLLSIYRNEEAGIFKSFVRAFAQNFGQSTIIWILYLLNGLALGICLYLDAKDILEFPLFVKYILYIAAALTIVSAAWVFVLQSRYDNPVWVTIKNTFIIGIAHVKYTIGMVLLFIAPFVLMILVPQAEPFVLFMGLSFPGFLQAMMYSKVFIKIENMLESSPSDSAEISASDQQE